MAFGVRVEYLLVSVSSALLAVGTVAACGGRSAETAPAGDDSTSGGAAASAGNGCESTPGGGGDRWTGGASSTGGMGASAGNAAPAAGSSGAASTSGVPPDECRGIRTNASCAPEGLLCESLPCGIADTGRRSCSCATNWTCTACDYEDSPIRNRVGPFPPCPSEAADDVACGTEWDICQAVGTEVCACWIDPEGRKIWDCDVPPACWCT